ncbi:MAG: sensor histidine kinase [Nitrosarchaeum sp.]|nr:MAG: sensor histidine kinase [Nitrosarchaeum sp.]
MSNASKPENTIKFKVSSKVARLLGRESVSSDTAALFELIKNSYDADATTVTVTFKDILNKDPARRTVIISDDGVGITHKEFEKKWMVIGTYSKEKEMFTKNGRRMLGNKGVGRFATEKLAKKLTLISQPISSKEKIQLDVDWGSYENENIEFNEIPNKIFVEKNRTTEDHGLTIILSNLRTDWNIKKLTRLLDAIGSMLIPKELQRVSKTRFDVKIIAPEFTTEIKPKAESLLFENAPFVVTCNLPSNTYKTTVTIKKSGNVVETPELDFENTVIKKTGQLWKPFGPCNVKLYFYPMKSSFESWDDYYKDTLKMANIRNILKDYHGVKIYRDDFWVSPYGGLEDDWLDLESERVQSNLKIGSTQVIGFVEISRDENPSVMDTTTREKLVENDSFHSMRHFVKSVVNELSEFRIKENKEFKEQSPKKIYENIIDSEIQSMLRYLEIEIDISDEVKNNISKRAKAINNNISKLSKITSSETKRSELETRGLLNLASLGILSANSYHEIFNIIGSMKETPTAIKTLLSKKTDNDDIVTFFLDELDDHLELIDQFTWLVRQFVKAIGNDVESKLAKENILLQELVSKIMNSYSTSTAKNIRLEITVVPNDFSVMMFKSDIISIILNLLTNAIKSVDLTEDDEKKIKMTIKKEAYDLSLIFSDNGIGIKDSVMPKIFRPFFSTYENGTGMGLSIVQDILSSYGGKIILDSKPEFGKGASFKISIPLKNLKE